MPHDVFISYASMERTEDRHVANALCVKLESRRIRCWVAHRDVPSGGRFFEHMYYAMKECRVCLVIVNERATASRYVQSEVKHALDLGKTILPVRIEELNDLGPLLTGMLNVVSWLDALPPPVERHLDQIVDRVETLLRPTPADPVRPERPYRLQEPPSVPERLGRLTLVCGTMALVLAFLYVQLVGPWLMSRRARDPGLVRLVHGTRWTTYEPRQFDPTRHVPIDDATLARELDALRAAGFNGLITFNSMGDIADIPRLAKARGFAVIAGVWDPNDGVELATAIANRPHVDAYCVGHNKLNSELYAYDDLARAIRHVRFRTRKPVTTTESLKRYAENPELGGLVDFLLPDAHAAIGEDPNLWLRGVVSADQTVAMVRTYREALLAPHKPVLLKMITYPAGETEDTRTAQAAFFEFLLRSRRDADPEIPLDFAISVHGAFDAPWKRDWPFYEWDRSTGLLDDDGAPRPAAEVIVRRLP